MQIIKATIERASLAPADKALLTALTWTFEKIPEIQNAKQYAVYLEIEKEIKRAMPHPQEQREEWVQWAGSPAGRLAGAYGARLIEWEEAQEVF